MKLDLTNVEASDIKYQVSRFPDGQQQVSIEYTPAGTKRVTIKSRLNNFMDLELIVCAVASLREVGYNDLHLYVPYFLGSRSDRKFIGGSNNYLKTVICPIINSLKFESVTVLDPHSDVLEACLNNFKKESNLDLVNKALRYWVDLHNETYENSSKNKYIQPEDKFVLISPDAGANKKIYKIAEQIGYTGDIINCSKSRDEEGKLSRVKVPISHDYNEHDVIIIDDICDGGATFINIAKVIRNNTSFKGKIYLIVTHGIFSKGLKELNTYFDGIYCTNSYSDMNSPEFSLANDNELHKLKQLNVF